jgi:hypothetical protein
MARQLRLWENNQCAQLLAPQASSATALILSSFVNLRYCFKAYLECDLNQGNAAPVTFTPLQSTSLLLAQAPLNAGSSSVTLSFAAVPAAVQQGMVVQDMTTSAAIAPGVTVVSATSTTVTLSAAASGALSGDVIAFLPSGSLPVKALSNPAPLAVITNTAQLINPAALSGLADQFSFPFSATSFTSGSALAAQSVIFEILPETNLDVNNLIAMNTTYQPGGFGYRYIGLQVSASNAANLVAARVKVQLSRDQRQSPPTLFQ